MRTDVSVKMDRNACGQASGVCYNQESRIRKRYPEFEKDTTGGLDEWGKNMWLT